MREQGNKIQFHLWPFNSISTSSAFKNMVTGHPGFVGSSANTSVMFTCGSCYGRDGLLALPGSNLGLFRLLGGFHPSMGELQK